MDPSDLPETSGFCQRHGLARLLSWGCFECPLCAEARLEGCVCGGTARCVDCMMLGGRHRVGPDGREYTAARCTPGCDTLCPKCCPDS